MISTGMWNLQPGLFVAFALDPCRSVRYFADRQAMQDASQMVCHRVTGIVNAVSGDWVQIMLVQPFDASESLKRLAEPCVPLSFYGEPFGHLAVFPSMRYDFRVSWLHATEGSAPASHYILRDVLEAARVQDLAIALYGPRCMLTAGHRWQLEDAARRMYSGPADAPSRDAPLPFIEVWAQFDLGDCLAPDSLDAELEQLNEIELKKLDRDEVRQMKWVLHRTDEPREEESVKKFLRRTFQRTDLSAIEDCPDGDASEKDGEEEEDWYTACSSDQTPTLVDPNSGTFSRRKGDNYVSSRSAKYRPRIDRIFV